MNCDTVLRITVGVLVLSISAVAGEIHDACKAGSIEQVRTLIAADPSLVRAIDERGRTGLHLAAGEGHGEVVGYLLDSGAEIEAVDTRGNTPLLSAIWGNHSEIVRLLADRGANLKAQHPSYGAGIDIAYWQECIQGKSGITEFLISRGEPFDPNSEFMATRLNLATTFGNYEMARFVVDLGADVNKVSTSDGMTELQFAVLCGADSIVRLLLERGASVDVMNNAGIPPMWHAVNGGHTDIVKMLLAEGASTDFVDTTTGQSLVHSAALKGYTDMLGLLLSSPQEVNSIDKRGRSPLYLAGRYGHSRAVSLLLERGATRPANYVENFGSPSSLKAVSAPGSGVVWALQGRGWAVKTAHHLLILDCMQSRLTYPTEPSLNNGFITASEIADQDTYVLYTTFHWPDLVEYVHKIEDSLQRVTYIHNKNEQWRGCKNTVYIEPNQTLSTGALRLRAIQVSHRNPGLGFVLEIDGVRMYWATFEPDDATQYAADLDSLKAVFGSVDLAIVPLPGEPTVGMEYLGSLYDKLAPRTFCFSSQGKLSYPAEVILETIKRRNTDAKVFFPEYPGDHSTFVVSRE